MPNKLSELTDAQAARTWGSGPMHRKNKIKTQNSPRPYLENPVLGNRRKGLGGHSFITVRTLYLTYQPQGDLVGHLGAGRCWGPWAFRSGPTEVAKGGPRPHIWGAPLCGKNECNLII